MPEGISTSHLDVRYIRTSVCDQSSILRRSLSRLTPDEQARAARYRFDEDGLAFALSRVLVRETLAGYCGGSREDYRFVRDRYGRPGLAPPSAACELHFNISHCRGMVTAAFAVARDIGVDVEAVDRCRTMMETAGSCFALEEVRWIEAWSRNEQPSAFCRMWTLKEAYIKARGMGLSIPLTDFAIGFDPLRISFTSRIADHAANWFLWQEQITPGHFLALAARQKPGAEPEVTLRETAIESLL